MPFYSFSQLLWLNSWIRKSRLREYLAQIKIKSNNRNCLKLHRSSFSTKIYSLSLSLMLMVLRHEVSRISRVPQRPQLDRNLLSCPGKRTYHKTLCEWRLKHREIDTLQSPVWPEYTKINSCLRQVLSSKLAAWIVSSCKRSTSVNTALLS